MAGHSKWSQIKRKKGVLDTKRGKIFTKIGRELVVAVRAGGADPDNNSRLRDIIAKAKANNMPNDNITRSIKKASGELSHINYEEIVYEGYGAGGVAVIVEALTDNKNRTAAEVRHSLDRSGGSLGTTGCVSYMFETRGVILAEVKNGLSEDDAMMTALECGADDFEASEDGYEVTTAVDKLSAVREALETKGWIIVSAEATKIPSSYIKLDEDNLNKFQKMLDALEDNDDVQRVWHNCEDSI
ncbi:MAG: YebC/PmpR family DNA-binding transcriptional regulator [Firmicutes bacterium]|nr:YebC/PmpR family DNA-binding transcriptional regulator [Bacillota bacterium]